MWRWHETFGRFAIATCCNCTQCVETCLQRRCAEYVNRRPTAYMKVWIKAIRKKSIAVRGTCVLRCHVEIIRALSLLTCAISALVVWVFLLARNLASSGSERGQQFSVRRQFTVSAQTAPGSCLGADGCLMTDERRACT